MSFDHHTPELLAEGIDRFNHGRFWDAHESWETVWLESAEPEKTFLQGLIQLAAAFYHFERGTLSGGVRLVDAAVEKLSRYPAAYMAIDRSHAVEAGLQARDRAVRAADGDSEKQDLSGNLPRLILL